MTGTGDVVDSYHAEPGSAFERVECASGFSLGHKDPR